VRRLCLLKNVPDRPPKNTDVKSLKDHPKMGALALVQNGDDVLTNLGLGTAKYIDLRRHLGMLSCVYLTLSWFGLSYFGPSFIDTYVK